MESGTAWTIRPNALKGSRITE